jgi:hypothetical protein
VPLLLLVTARMMPMTATITRSTAAAPAIQSRRRLRCASKARIRATRSRAACLLRSAFDTSQLLAGP